MKAKEFAVMALLKSPDVRTSRIVAMFSDIYEDEDAWMANPYEFRIVHRGSDRFYVTNGKLERIDLEGAKQIITPHTLVSVPEGWCANLPGAQDVYFGELLMNYIILVQPFGAKIPFQHGEFNINKVESLIAPKVIDIGDVFDDTSIKASCLDRYYDACKYFETFGKIFNFSSSEVAITEAPGTKDLKKSLLEGKYSDIGSDVSKLLSFEKELHAHDDKYLATDPFAEVFVRGKMRDMARKKVFLSQGIEPGLGSIKATNPITRSLGEGWEPRKEVLAAQMNVAVAASFSKGWSTRKAGYAGKVLTRAMSSFNIVKYNETTGEGDCGVTEGLLRHINPGNSFMFIGSAIRENNQWVVIDNAAMANDLNGQYTTRSAAFCRLAPPDICGKCAGKYLSLNSSRVGSAAADLSAALLMLAMKAVHGVSPKTVRYNLKDAIIF